MPHIPALSLLRLLPRQTLRNIPVRSFCRIVPPRGVRAPCRGTTGSYMFFSYNTQNCVTLACVALCSADLRWVTIAQNARLARGPDAAAADKPGSATPFPRARDARSNALRSYGPRQVVTQGNRRKVRTPPPRSSRARRRHHSQQEKRERQMQNIRERRAAAPRSITEKAWPVSHPAPPQRN